VGHSVVQIHTDPRYGVGIGFFQDRNDLGIGKSASLNVAHVN